MCVGFELFKDDIAHECIDVSSYGDEVSRKWKRSHRPKKEKRVATTLVAAAEVSRLGSDVKIISSSARKWFRRLG